MSEFPEPLTPPPIRFSSMPSVMGVWIFSVITQCVRFPFVKFEAFEFFFLGLKEEPFLRSYLIELITFKALEKCETECNMLEIILVQGFSPLKSKITQYYFLMDSFLKVTCPARKSTCSDGLPDGTFFNPYMYLWDQKYCL